MYCMIEKNAEDGNIPPRRAAWYPTDHFQEAHFQINKEEQQRIIPI